MPSNSNRAFVTYLLTTICMLVSLPAMLIPSLYHALGGIGELRYFWQPFTAVFMHGFPGLPMPLHLMANMTLLLFCGTLIEGLLGWERFAWLMTIAIFVAGLVRLISTLEFNGSSAFIWSYSPIMLIALWQGRFN